MAEERCEAEDVEEGRGGEKGDTAPKSAPCSPVLLRKRPLPSTSSLSPQPVVPCRKKTRELPNLYNCHSCGLRFPDKGRNETLQTLDSQWRVVLLCSSCLLAIRSAKVCSYCFSEFSKEDGSGGFIDCRQCSCRVHLTCLPKQRGYVVPLDLDPCSFTCVDCCALPKFFSTKPGSSCSTRVSTVCLEDVVRDANSIVAKKAAAAARAKEKALEKAMAAKRAADLARNALDLAVLASKGASPPSVNPTAPDKELALQLHLEMNGSQRISRSHSSRSSRSLLNLKKAVPNGCREVQVCTEIRSFRNLDGGGGEPLVHVYVSQMDSAPDVGSWSKYPKNKSNEQSRDILDEIPAKEGQASCSDKVANSVGDDNSVESVSGSCQRSNGSYDNLGLLKSNGGEGEDSAAAQQNMTCIEPDRYLKKYYCRRNFRLKETVDNKESVGSAPVLATCLHMSCSNASRTFSDAPYESPTIAMHVSANASGSSGCRS